MTFSQALRAVLAQAWPEATANGFYRAVQIARVPVERLANKLPVVAIDSELRNSTEWGRKPTDTGTVTIYYITSDADHVEDDLEPKLRALRNALWPAPGLLQFGQVIERPSISTSISLPLNRHFLNQQKPLLAGAVMVPMLVWDVPETP